MVVLLLIVTLAFTCAVLALVGDGAQLRRRIDQLERRLALVEIDAATSIVVDREPEAETTARRVPPLLN